ncbi:hypothetical protein J3A83DRAFT_4188935 [Scleroderma citrinum]
MDQHGNDNEDFSDPAKDKEHKPGGEDCLSKYSTSTHQIPNYFSISASLLLSMMPSVLKPYHTFTTPTTGFHLAIKPFFLILKMPWLPSLQIGIHVSKVHNIQSPGFKYGTNIHPQSDWPRDGLVGHSVTQLHMIFHLAHSDLFLINWHAFAEIDSVSFSVSVSNPKTPQKGQQLAAHVMPFNLLHMKSCSQNQWESYVAEKSDHYTMEQVIVAINKACATVTIRMWSTDSATHPLNGGNVVRKPDMSCWLATGSKFNWRHLTTFAEVKNHRGKDNKKSLMAVILLHASASLVLRYTSQFLIVKSHQDRLVDVKELKIKMDATIYTIELTRVLFISDNLFSQGTMVWEGMMKERGTSSMQTKQVAMKDLWIDPLQKYTEGKILSILNMHKIKGVSTLVHKEQVKAPYPSTIDNIQVNHSTHFLQAYLAQYKTNAYYLHVLSHIITQPVGNLITEFSCLGELLVAFIDYVVDDNHLEFIQKISGLSAAEKAALCTRIVNVKQQGVLADWGYAVPMTEPTTITDLVTTTSLIEQPSQVQYKSSNFVPIMPVNSKGTLTSLSLVSDLTKEDDIALAMGPASTGSDPQHTIDTSPLYHTPSMLKTIMIQLDLTWKPFILQHISEYFKPIINLLTYLCNAIIVPLSTDDHGNISHKAPFTHDMFIATIIQMLSELGPDMWTAVD